MKELEKLFKKELEKTTKYIEEENKSLKLKISELENKIVTLQDVNKELSRGDLFSKYAKNINEENISEFLTFIFKEKTNIINNNQVTKAPAWFFNIVTYWEHKQTVLTIYDMAKIKYPSWILNFKLPYEWNQEEIDVWFETMGKHYVCNGAIYDNNLGFWLGTCANRTPIENMKKSTYSEIPWNLVLKNPLFLEDDNFNKLIKSIKEKGHGLYFADICDYQTLPNDKIERLVSELNKANQNLKYGSIRDAINKIIRYGRLQRESVIWDELYKTNDFYVYDLFPDRVRKEIIKDKPDSISKLSEMINSKLFSIKELNDVLLKIIKK